MKLTKNIVSYYWPWYYTMIYNDQLHLVQRTSIDNCFWFHSHFTRSLAELFTSLDDGLLFLYLTWCIVSPLSTSDPYSWWHSYPLFDYLRIMQSILAKMWTLKCNTNTVLQGWFFTSILKLECSFLTKAPNNPDSNIQNLFRTLQKKM